MRDILEKFGFIMIHTCNCAGTLKESWQHPNFLGLLIDIKPNRGKFEFWYLKEYYSGNSKEFGDVIRKLVISNSSPDSKNPRRLILPQTKSRCCGKKRGLE